MDHLKKLSFHNVEITGGFWKARQDLNRNTTIYAVRDRFEDTWRFKAFNFGYKEGGDEPKPHFFWDSDVAKWIESVADIIDKHPDPVLEAKVEEIIDCVEAHQDANGYFNIYHTVAFNTYGIHLFSLKSVLGEKLIKAVSIAGLQKYKYFPLLFFSLFYKVL